METKHTKGEWKIGDISIAGREFISEKPLYHCNIVDTSGKLVIEVWGHTISTEEVAANAKLIAAAPELFEACIESLAALKTGYIEQRANATKLILAAIKKATE